MKGKKYKKVLRVSIEKRPESVEIREEFSHWEMDTVFSHKSNDNALLTLVERKSRHKIVKRIDSQTASAVTQTLNELCAYSPNVQRTFKTNTSDNGSEFSELPEQGKGGGIDVYFVHFYASE